MHRQQGSQSDGRYGARGDVRADVGDIGRDGAVGEEPGESELVEEADVICVMEEAHRRHIRDRFGDTHAGKVVVLDIPDNYVCWEEKLIHLLKSKLRAALGLSRTSEQ